ncbi:MAG: beta-N-acetylhexosaminidase family protein [Pseudonocardiaceae bacterium]
MRISRSGVIVPLFALTCTAALVAFAQADSAESATPSQAATLDRIPAVYPKPQQLTPKPGVLPLSGGPVAEVIGPRTDPSAIASVDQTLRGMGDRKIIKLSPDAPDRYAALTVYIGGPTENQATAGALRALRAGSTDGLAAEGYVLASGTTPQGNIIALSGVDRIGTFYAAQTLSQLVVRFGPITVIQAVTVRDWPAMPLRGVIEGFYGSPWSQANRLSQLDFYGRTKQNIYVYSPKDDLNLRARWRDIYSPDRLATIKTLVDKATVNHVEFTYALSPGSSACYSSDADEKALVAKFQSLWDIGVRSFTIPLDDISYTSWNCDADAAKFGAGAAGAGDAQSFLLNRVQRDFINTHPGAQRLQMVPTEYHDVTPSGYKTEIRTKLDPKVIVEWTGLNVIAAQITESQARQAEQVFGHDILAWDNYPVNDYIANRLLMGPYVGREPRIAKDLVDITANPMVQEEASKIGEFTSADFGWNPQGYDPDASWSAGLADLGGTATPALKVFVENNYGGVLARLGNNAKDLDSPVLRPLLAAFFVALDGKGDLREATTALNGYLVKMASDPAQLRGGMRTNPDFLTEIAPWLDKLGLYGQVGQHATRMLCAVHAGNRSLAWSERQQVTAIMKKAYAITVPTPHGSVAPQVSVNVFEPFIKTALTRTNASFRLPPVAVVNESGTK